MTSVDRKEIWGFIQSLGFIKPLFFASDMPEFPYYCGGTCFLVRYNDKYYILTAKHCLRDNPSSVYVQTNAQVLIPVRRLLNLNSIGEDSAWTDICCLTTYPEHLPVLETNDYIDFNQMHGTDIIGYVNQQLVLKSYPHHKCLVTDRNDSVNLLRAPTIHMGRFGGPTESRHCHFFRVEYPDLDDPNGMSGAPVVKLDYHPIRGCYPTVVGMVLQGSSAVQFLRFVGVDVLFRFLAEVQKAPF